ncbi:ABC transporter permease [Hymenobacter cellulosivorans]|uniref:ABC transporter permease n=1 Tax=Hymenobacter cellulosivorans TaxID=2932249 RepID=A0ABY4FG86_9BACT|nr:ABC transporter permease [Hymenobacter cellulosivorans]UOQ55415.1 ABC transporter permease [Hymenobacter cellulosivorans]
MSLPLHSPTPFLLLRRTHTADWLKLRRTLALWLALGGGALPVLLNFLIIYFRGEKLLAAGENPWRHYIHMSWQTASVLLLPLFLILLTSLLVAIENRATAWKHLYALPVSRGAVLGSKLLVLLQLNLLAQVVYVVLLLASGKLLGWLRPELLFGAYPVPLAGVIPLLAHTYLATLGILGIQYVAALWWRSFALPFAFGIGGLVAALTLLRWEHVDWVPYAAPTRVLSLVGKDAQGLLTVQSGIGLAEWSSLAWFAAALLVGYGLLSRWKTAD